MKRYKVIRDCVGFRSRMWKEGTLVEVEDYETPPHHFQLLVDVVELPVVIDPARGTDHSYSSLSKAGLRPPIPKTGIAAYLTPDEDVTVKRGAKKKATKGSG